MIFAAKLVFKHCILLMWVTQRISMTLLNNMVEDEYATAGNSGELLALATKTYDQIFALVSSNEFWSYCIRLQKINSNFDSITQASLVNDDIEAGIIQGLFISDNQLCSVEANQTNLKAFWSNKNAKNFDLLMKYLRQL